jgi:hypothetical protein
MLIKRCLSRVTALFCAALIPVAVQALQPGTYRCASYNVSGGGGSCRTFQQLVLNPDGTYLYSSTQGQWRVQAGRLLLSASTLWGTGEVLGDDAVRFKYDYRGWRHVVTWTCQTCAAGGVTRPATGRLDAPQAGGSVGVTLSLKFDQSVGGVSGFVIVPAESAGGYTHNAPLPQGAVQGLAWETSPNIVQIATSRANKLMTGRRYVVFLAWPRETLPVAILDLPATDRDYTATLPAQLNIRLSAPAPSQPSAGSGQSRGDDAGSLVEALASLGKALGELGRAMESGGARPSPSAAAAPPIGVRLTDVTTEIAQALGNADLRGAGIVEVLPSSLADQAGVQAGDVITAVDNTQVQSASDAFTLIRNRRVESPLDLVIFRAGGLHVFRIGATVAR